MSDRAANPPSGCPRILVCGWAGAGNVGDELLTRAIAEVLHREGADVVVASRDPRATELAHPGVEAVPWGVAGLRSMGRVDGVCVGPGGILQDTSSLWSLPFHLAMPWRAVRSGATVAAIGVGAEPLRFPWSGWMLRRVLRGAPVVTRDSASSAVLRGVGLDPVTGIDVVFGLVPPFVEEHAEIVVAIGPSTRPGVFAPASRRLVQPSLPDVITAIEEVARREDCRVVLTRFRGRRDAETAATVARRLTVDHEILGDDVDEHVRRIAGARMVISSRYHPVVLAAASGTPVAVISDQRKVIALVDQLDDPSVQRVTSWSDLPDLSVGPRRGAALVPAGLDAAHEALAALVAAASEARGGCSLG